MTAFGRLHETKFGEANIRVREAHPCHPWPKSYFDWQRPRALRANVYCPFLTLSSLAAARSSASKVTGAGAAVAEP